MRFCVLAICCALLLSCQKKPTPYSRLIEKFREAESAENAAFSQLAFRPVSKSFPPSITYKVTLEDQLGRLWLFKAGSSTAMDGAVIVYRVSNLFGYDTPEIHYKKLTLNGEEVEGTIQRVIPNIGPLESFPLTALPSPAKDYLARSHVISYLLANHHVHAEQFLVLSQDGKTPSNLLRIDNSVDWFLLGRDRFDLDFHTPMISREQMGYGTFWRQYILKGILGKEWSKEFSAYADPVQFFDLDLPAVHRWVAFIAGFPDTEYLDFFSRGLAQGMDHLSAYSVAKSRLLVPELTDDPSPATFRIKILDRKHELPNELKKMYEKMAAFRGEKLTLTGGNSDLIADALIARLQAAIDAHRAVPIPSATQEALTVPISFSAYQALDGLSLVWKIAKKREFLDAKISLLQARLQADPHGPGSQGVKNAIQNLQTLQSLLARGIRWPQQHSRNYGRLFDAGAISANPAPNPVK